MGRAEARLRPGDASSSARRRNRTRIRWIFPGAISGAYCEMDSAAAMGADRETKRTLDNLPARQFRDRRTGGSTRSLSRTIFVSIYLRGSSDRGVAISSANVGGQGISSASPVTHPIGSFSAAIGRSLTPARWSGVRMQKIGVKLLPSIDDCGQRKVKLDELAPSRAHRFSLFVRHSH